MHGGVPSSSFEVVKAGEDDVLVEAPSAMTETAESPAAAPMSVGNGSRTYNRFWEMPVWFVLGVTWLAGAALMGSFALVLYLVVSALI